jgi:hypothetical protein
LGKRHAVPSAMIFCGLLLIRGWSVPKDKQFHHLLL